MFILLVLKSRLFFEMRDVVLVILLYLNKKNLKRCFTLGVITLFDNKHTLSIVKCNLETFQRKDDLFQVT